MPGHFYIKVAKWHIVNMYYVERNQWNIDNEERLSTHTPFEIIHNLHNLWR